MDNKKQVNEKDEVAQRLVDWWFQVEPGIKEVYRFISPNEDAPNEPLKLLEISEATFDTGRVDIFGFAPDGDITVPVASGSVTPGEFERIRNGQIPLPTGWDLSTAKVYRQSRKSSRRKKRTANKRKKRHASKS